MKNQKFLLTLWGFVLGVGAFYVSAGCAPYDLTYIPQRKPALPVTHTYTLSIVDVYGLPAESVSVHYSAFDLNRLVQDTTVMTNSDGLISISFRATAAPGDEYPRSYRSELHYRVTKDGYYEKSGTLNAEYGEDYSLEKPTAFETVELVKPTDYFDPDFLASQEGMALKANILNIIDTLRSSIRSDTYMEVQTIQIVSFKEKKYLTLKFIDTNTYNSLKLSKYDIAKTLFDEVVKRALAPFMSSSEIQRPFTATTFPLLERQRVLQKHTQPAQMSSTVSSFPGKPF
ncbi:MAG: hypothetical protein L0Y80_08980 [Ignavibacteriae bacterium]|nr:hypothetical protein [Ignavibacteriota bacterium]